MGKITSGDNQMSKIKDKIVTVSAEKVGITISAHMPKQFSWEKRSKGEEGV